ncbi:MAG: RNA polymerase sigma factor [Granulosicoccus sp.]
MLKPESGCGNTRTLDQAIDKEVQLIRSVAKGDRQAFEQLFRLYHPRIYKFSIRMLQDHSAAEEVAADTLYAVWGSASGFREQSAVSSWILGIAYRRSLKSYRKTARHTENREPSFELETLAEQSSAVDPETHTSNELEVSKVQKAMSTLSSNHRAVMELIALGYSVGEIATIVECPENTVKTRTFHARRQLQAALTD